MNMYDLTISEILRIRKALAQNPHMEAACDLLLTLCEEWGHDSRIGTMTLSNKEGLASLNISFRLPFKGLEEDDQEDLGEDMEDEDYLDFEDYKGDCELLRSFLVQTGEVSDTYPLRSIYRFWRDYSESYCAGWMSYEGMKANDLLYYFQTWVEDQENKKRG